MAKTPAEIGSLAREACPKAINTLRGIMNSKKASEGARIQASNSLLDRGLGKPAQALTVAGDPSQPLTLALDESELVRRLASLLDQADKGYIEGPIVDITPESVALDQSSESST